MSAGPAPLTVFRGVVRRERRGPGCIASVVVCGAVPLFALAVMFYEAIATDGVAYDFRVFYAAAEAALRGESIYPPADDPVLVAGRAYVYPPFTALALAPLTAMPIEVAGLLVMSLLLAAALAIPLALGVRDWRCYGLALLWPPVLSAVQTGAVSILLALLAALVWRFRERRVRPGLALGAALAVKLVLWPVALWLAARRRLAAVAWATVGTLALVLGSWAVVAFDGFLAYPELLRRLSSIMDERGYTVYSLALELGAPSPAARALWLAVALGLLAGVVASARRGEVRRSFLLAIAASLACTPIVWLHYFALLLVVVAIAQPQLGPLWVVPLAMYLTPGSGDPTPFQTSATVLTAALTVALAVRAAGEREIAVPAPGPSARVGRAS